VTRTNSYVHVIEVGDDGSPTGRAQWFGPQDTVPEWAYPYMTNPKIWAEPPGAKTAEVPPPPSEPATAPVQAEAPANEVKAPPRGGAGSGRSEWATYATAKGVDVGEDLKSRDDIIAALELAGIPIE
jgi:hypothetical protein